MKFFGKRKSDLSEDERNTKKNKRTIDKERSSSQDWVIVRVWLPTLLSGKFATAHEAGSKGGSVGHVSLETESIYASLWPE